MTGALRSRTAVGLASLALLGGCSSLGGFAGAVAGIATGTFSSNPAVGVAVGISVKAATDTALQKVFRDMQADEQDQIAELAGSMAVGDKRAWRVHHTWSFGDEAGEVEVLGAIENALATCKEVMFSVASGKTEPTAPGRFITQACRETDGRWRWASAEPATARWGSLQ